MVQRAGPVNDVPTEPIHRLSVAQYDAMTRAGILGPDDRVELLEGWLVEKMTKNPPHRIATRKTRVALDKLVPAGWYVDSQEPIVTADSEPEPDVAVVQGRTEDYVDANPPASRVGLVVEIADASLVRDRKLKARIYGRAGIPTYWIVDLARRVVLVHTGPTASGYASVTERGESARVAFALGASVIGEIAVAELLP